MPGKFFPHQKWRLLVTPVLPGAHNMAIDEALLTCVEKHLSIPILRLYAWEPACLSLGYAQPWTDIDQVRLRGFGWDWVRRPTGGRAILHTDELTYSVIAPLADPRVAGSVLESYQTLSAALLTGLRSLNIAAEAHLISPTKETEQKDAAVCFEVPSNYEIVVGGKKLIGSAQARRKEGVLQHGSIPLHGDLARITNALAYPDEISRHEAAIRLLTHATTVEAALGYHTSWDTVAQAVVMGFNTELNLEFIRSELTEDEIVLSQQLMAEKYNHPAWLERI